MERPRRIIAVDNVLRCTSRIYVVLACLLVLGSFLRLYRLGSQSYWMDESFTIAAVQAIEERGASVLDSGRAYACPLYCYPTAGIARALGDSALSYRLLAAIAGIAAIAVVFFAARELTDDKVALIAALGTACSYLEIAWSRQARWYSLFEALFWLSILFFALAINRRQHQWWFGAAAIICAALAIATTAIGILLPVLFLVWFFMNRRACSWRNIAIGLIVSTALGIAYLYLSGSFEALAGLLKGMHIRYELPYYLSFYVRTYWFFLAFVLVALWEGSNPHRAAIRMLGAAVLIYLLPLSLLTDIVQYRYLFMMTPALFILGAIGMQSIAARMPQKWRPWYWAALVTAFFTIGTGVLLPRSAYFLEADNPATLGARPHYAYTPEPDWAGAYAYIAAHRAPGMIVISSLTTMTEIYLHEPGYWLAYDYQGGGNIAQWLVNGRDLYTNAPVVGSLPDLQNIMQSRHGCIVFDYLAADNVSEDELDYVEAHATLVFHEETNTYSQIWVYEF